MNTLLSIITTPFSILEDVIDCFEDCIVKFAIIAIPTILAMGFAAGMLF